MRARPCRSSAPSSSRLRAGSAPHAVALAAMLTATLAGFGCRETLEAPPVVLIVVDTLRFDRSVPQRGRETAMPAWRRFAEQGVEFTDVEAASSWTGAAVASIFTGRYADRVGIRELRDTLPTSARTLAEALGDAGYETRAVVSNAILAKPSATRRASTSSSTAPTSARARRRARAGDAPTSRPTA